MVMEIVISGMKASWFSQTLEQFIAEADKKGGKEKYMAGIQMVSS